MTNYRRWRVAPFSIAAVAMVGSSSVLFGYTYLRYHWSSASASSGIVMHLQLGPSGGILLDGASSWGSVAEGAMATWNQVLSLSRFKVVRDSTIPIRAGDGRNSVFFSSTVFGSSFGSDTLAVATTWTRAGRKTESDVVFNTGKDWNSYRGDLRPGINDFRRVALHEFGHVLGLDHPDEAGQGVDAVMNSRTSEVEDLTSDDILGVQNLAGTSLRFLSCMWKVNQWNRRATVSGRYQNSSSRLSGTTNLVLWMSKRRYPSGGFRVAQRRVGQVGAGQTTSRSFHGRARLPRRRGIYHCTIVLEEFTIYGWLRKSWLRAQRIRIR